MVMDYAVFETNLHMINHYKRINSAKGVVNTSAPRCYQLRYKNVSNLTSRYSTPSLMSTSERNPSRANSNCEVRRRKNSVILPVPTGERSSSVPPRPCTRRNQNVLPQNYMKMRSPYPKINDNSNTRKIPIKTERKITIKSETPKSSAPGSSTNSPKHNFVTKPEKNNKNIVQLKSPVRKVPVPAPRQIRTEHKTVVQDYEYLQFSLRITEDIIRNDLYSQKEMRRVFNSHIEANRGRLNMTKMLHQIDHLCKELEISKRSSRNLTNKENKSTCSCKTKENVQTKETNLISTNSSRSQNSKQDLLKKIVDGKYEMSEEEIHELTEYDLQNVISGIMNNDSDICSVCHKNNEPEITAEFVENDDSKSENPKSDVHKIVSAKPSHTYLDLIHSNVENFNCVSDINLLMNSSCVSEDSCKTDSTRDPEVEEKSINYEDFLSPCENKENRENNKQIETGSNVFSITTRDPTYSELETKNVNYEEFFCPCENKENQKNNEEEQLESLNIIEKKSKSMSDNLSNIKNVEEKSVSKDTTIVENTILDDLIKNKCLVCDGKQDGETINTKTIEEKIVTPAENIQNPQSTVLSGFPINLEKDESINQICLRKKSKDNEKENESILKQKFLDVRLSTNELIKRGDLYSLLPICSEENDIVETEQNQLPEKEQQSDLYVLDPICSCSSKTGVLLSHSNVTLSTKEQNTVKMCTLDPFCSKQFKKLNETVERKQNQSDIPVSEQNKTVDLSDSIYVTLSTKEQNTVCSHDSFCSQQLKNLNETVETKQKQSDIPLSEQNKIVNLSDSIFSKQIAKENEVSIVEQRGPVDIVGNTASIKTVSLDTKNTQTSFTEKSECVCKSYNSSIYHFACDSNFPSTSKKNEHKIVYENDNKSNLDNSPKCETESQKKEKNEFISSITKFILEKTFAKSELSSRKKELQNKCSEKPEIVSRTNEEKSVFVSTVEKLINDRTKDLYQYSLPEKKKFGSSEIPRISVDSLDKYQTEYRREVSKHHEITKIKRKNSVSNKKSDSSLSEGEISRSSSSASFTKKITNKINRTSQPQILEHLKKYEQNKMSPTNNSVNSCLHNYELKFFEEDYVPKFRRSMFFPAVSTQTSGADINFKPGFKDNLLSDGEIQNTSSETEDTKTEFSESSYN